MPTDVASLHAPLRMTTTGLILCGGQSSRMGRPKVWLPFAGATLLQHVERQLAAAVDHVLVVAAVGQELPPLQPATSLIADREPLCGPLEGLRAGLEAVGTVAGVVYVTGCDAPWILPAFVHRLFALIEHHDAAALRIDGRVYPLSAAYRPRLLPTIESRLAAGQRGMCDLLATVDTRYVSSDEVCEVDPQLASLTNLNLPDDYAAAMRQLRST